MRRSERGFTLFEVLAAVAILGILYTVLAASAMDGLRAEGISKRRLQASLLADRRLAEIELELDLGAVPPLGQEEEEDGDFTVRRSVEPFDLILPELEIEGTPAGPLLADLTADRSSPLRLVRLTVAWLEAEAEYAVHRSTFGFDLNALDPSLLPEPGTAPEPAAEGEEEQTE